MTIEKMAPRRNYPEQRGSSKSVEKVERVVGGGLGSINIVNHNQIQIEMEKDALANWVI